MQTLFLFLLPNATAPFCHFKHWEFTTTPTDFLDVCSSGQLLFLIFLKNYKSKNAKVDPSTSPHGVPCCLCHRMILLSVLSLHCLVIVSLAFWYLGPRRDSVGWWSVSQPNQPPCPKEKGHCGVSLSLVSHCEHLKPGQEVGLSLFFVFYQISKQAEPANSCGRWGIGKSKWSSRQDTQCLILVPLPHI